MMLYERKLCIACASDDFSTGDFCCLHCLHFYRDAKTMMPVSAQSCCGGIVTSEGCFQVVRRRMSCWDILRQELSPRNIQVIPLGFHVDYWTVLGGKTIFFGRLHPAAGNGMRRP